MRSAAFLASLLALVAPVPAAAQVPPPPAAAAQGPVTVIHAGTLLDRPGRAPRTRASIVVRGGRIEAVQDGFAPVPEGGRLIDLSDRFVLPGLIDSHVHLTSDRAGVEGQLAELTESVPLRSYEAAWNARKTLDAGFTTVRNLGSDDGVTLGLRDAIARGWAVGPRIVDAGTSHLGARPGTWIRRSACARSFTTICCVRAAPATAPTIAAARCAARSPAAPT